MKNIHRSDDSFVIQKNNMPFHLIKGMAEYEDIKNKYLQNKNEFDEETIPEFSLANNVRKKRNELLQQTDYMFFSDYPLESEAKEKLISYRQKLRDISKQPDFPNQVDWPEIK